MDMRPLRQVTWVCRRKLRPRRPAGWANVSTEEIVCHLSMGEARVKRIGLDPYTYFDSLQST